MVVKELSEEYGLKQEQSARRLGITQSAISYYLSGSRGAGDIGNHRITALRENPRVKGAVKQIAKGIASDKMTTMQIIGELCETCKALRSREDICKMHIKAVPSIGRTCNLCQSY
jgi:hypothetical protein